MDKTTVAAIDLGATSGRLIAGSYSNSGLELTEVHRFPNAFRQLADNYYWDPGELYAHICAGLIKAKELFPRLASCGVDTWGVDFALVKENGRLCAPVHAYRDPRTEGILSHIQSSGDARKLYEWTGLPPINYNTGLQIKETLSVFPELSQMADRALFLPDYFNYLLSGQMVNEFSIASTSQLLDLTGETYSEEAMQYFGVPFKWFEGPEKAGNVLGKVINIDGLEDVSVSLVPGHDTSCAFEAIPRSGKDFIISSGTWLLAGAFTENPAAGQASLDYGISNERTGMGGYRPCKILVGLWLLEQVLPFFSKRPRDDAEWSALIEAAESVPACDELIDTTDKALFNPKNMKEVIDSQFTDRNLAPPQELPQYVRLICDSLGQSVSIAVDKFKELTGHQSENIVIVGGGSKNRLLCQSIADRSGLPVTSFNLEATSVGNIGYQLLALGAIKSLAEFHEAIMDGLNKKVYSPRT